MVIIISNLDSSLTSEGLQGGGGFCTTMVVYHLHEKSIWFQTVQMERKNFD